MRANVEATRARKKEIGNACEEPSSKNLFWLMIIVVTFAGIQCISPR